MPVRRILEVGAKADKLRLNFTTHQTGMFIPLLDTAPKPASLIPLEQS